jgi:hypothetical protein
MINITVTNIREVDGHHQIEHNCTFHFKDDTYSGSAYCGYIVVETGEMSSAPRQSSWGSSGAIGCISPNLNEGDLIYTSENWGINETISRGYPEEERNTNHLILSEIQENSNVTLDAYWDKTTGVLVELLLYVQDMEHMFHLTMQLIETNIWVVPEFPSILILPVLIISTAIAVFWKRIGLREKRSSSWQQQSVSR